MDVDGDVTLNFKPQAILVIVITEGYADKIACPSKDNYFAYITDRCNLPVIER